MEHWFDKLAKGAASPDMSRRSFLGGLTAALVTAASGFGMREAFAVAAHGGKGGVHANPNNGIKRPVGPRPPMPSKDVNFKLGPCAITRKGKQEVRAFTSTTTTGGHTVEIIERRIKGPEQTQHNFRINVDGKLQYLAVRRKANKGGAISGAALEITAGPGFGERGMHLTSQDGKTLTGKVNGRPIAPYDMSGGGTAAPQF